MSSGELSVVIPAYNAEAVIANSIASAMRVADVVVVVDDGSSDSTAVVAERLGARVLRRTNGGAYSARKAGANLVESEFMTFLDADDQLLAEGVSRSIDILKSDHKAGVVAGTVVGHHSSGRRKRVARGYSDASAASLIQHGYSPWPPAAQIIRTGAYLAQLDLPIPELAPRYADDFELLLRLSIVSSVLTHGEPSCLYRVDGGKSALNALRVVECKERIRSYYGAYYSLSWEPLTRRQMRAAAYARIAHAALNRGDYGEALVHIVRIAMSDPAVGVRALSRRLRAI